MTHANFNSLANRGRKAGLNTRELYQALASHSTEGQDMVTGRSDENGYIPEYTQEGQLTFRPVDKPSTGS